MSTYRRSHPGDPLPERLAQTIESARLLQQTAGADDQRPAEPALVKQPGDLLCGTQAVNDQRHERCIELPDRKISQRTPPDLGRPQPGAAARSLTCPLTGYFG